MLISYVFLFLQYEKCLQLVPWSVSLRDVWLHCPITHDITSIGPKNMSWDENGNRLYAACTWQWKWTLLHHKTWFCPWLWLDQQPEGHMTTQFQKDSLRWTKNTPIGQTEKRNRRWLGLVSLALLTGNVAGVLTHLLIWNRSRRSKGLLSLGRVKQTWPALGCLRGVWGWKTKESLWAFTTE